MTDEKLIISADISDVPDRKRMEEASQRSEELLRSYFESGLVGMAISLPDAGFLQVNNAFCKMLGYSSKELMQMRWTDFTHPDDVGVDIANAKRVATGELDSYTRDKRFIRKDSEIVHVTISVTCYRKKDGAHDYNVVFVQDITERKQGEELLRRSEHIVNATNEFMAFVDKEFVYRSVNQRYLDAYQKTIDEMIGHHVAEFLDADFYENIVKEQLDRCLAGEQFDYQNWRTFPGLGRVYVDVSYFPYREADGTVGGVVITARDITDRKKVEDELKRYEHIVSGSTNHLAFIDKDYRYQVINEAYIEVFNKTREEIVGKHLEEIVGPDAFRIAKPYFDQCLSGKSVNYQLTIDIPTLGKRIREVQYDPHFNNDGSVDGVVANIRDITERKKAEDTLLRYQLMLSGAERITHIGSYEYNHVTNTSIRSEEIYRIFEQSYDEFPATFEGFLEFVHPDDREEMVKLRQEALLNKTTLESEYRILLKDGRMKYIYGRNETTYDDDGNPLISIGSMQDTTKRKKAEEELNQYKHIVDSTDNMMALIDGDYLYRAVNQQYLDAYQKDRDEVIGHHICDVMGITFFEDFGKEHIDRCLAGESFNLQDWREYPGIGQAYMDVNFSPYREPDRKIAGVVLSIRNITAQKRAEEELSKYQHIVSSSSNYLAYIDKEYRYQAVNDAYLGIFNRTREEIVGKHIEEIIGAEAFKIAKSYFEQCLSGESVNYELTIDLPTLGNRVHEVQYDPHFNTDGSVAGVVINVRDITEQRQAEETVRLQSEITLNLAEGIYLIRKDDLKIVYTFPRFENMFGYGPGEMIGKHVSIVHPQTDKSPEEIANGILDVLNKTGEWHGEVLNVKKDGTLFWCYVNVSVFEHPQYGEVLISVHTDITERKLIENALQDSERHYRALFEDSVIPLWEEDFSEINKAIRLLQQNGVSDFREYFEKNPDKVKEYAGMVKVIDVNKAVLTMYGANSTEDISKGLSAIFTEETLSVFKEILISLVEGNVSCEFETLVKTLGGAEKHIDLRLSVVPSYEKTLERMYLSTIDITERKRNEEELQKLSRAVEATSSSVIITDKDGNIEYVNPKFTEVTGYTKEEVMGKNPSLLQSGETPEAVYADLWETIASGGEWKGEFHNKTKDDSLYRSRASISGVKDANGEIAHFIGIQEDVTHEYELTEQLNYQASHDALTGLINRHEFERRAERLLTTTGQDETEHALCYMDLDQFKVVNDTCGHIAGDELLRQLGSILQHAVRKRDTLARLGGDEFGVLMEHCSLAQAYRVAGSLQKAIQDYQFSWEGQSFRVGVSIGLVAITKIIPNLTELLKQADAACYVAKDSGRNRIHVHHVDDTELAQRHGEMQWVVRLQRALEEDRFCLYAQAIVPLDGSHGTHYELLVRMLDEEGQLILPGAFLPAAERYNLIVDIDYWVIEQAMTLLAQNPAFQQQIQFISINLSGQSLTTPDVLNFIITRLKSSGVEPDKLCFEITETAAISNLSTAVRFISTLKALGCRFALDDFGSGLSSFAYLKNLPVDYLKIDGMFVRNIDNDAIDHAMVKSINEIGQVMGMQTIAEFVENEMIKGMIKEIGVNYAQGYGIGKPQLFEELLDRSTNVTHINRPEKDEYET